MAPPEEEEEVDGGHHQNREKTEKEIERERKKLEKQQLKQAKKEKAKAKAQQWKQQEDDKQEKEMKSKVKRHGADEAETLEKALEEVNAVPPGEKKPKPTALPKGYSPKYVEARWYEWWEQKGFFQAENASNKPAFTMVIPPPNVTGALHIGHALTNSIQARTGSLVSKDTIVRWRRMSGYNTLWLPGVDHAGIATQTVVEKKLAAERGVSKHDLGREKFLREVFDYKDKYGGKICSQLRRLGSSLDWSRECFTMDENLSHAVNEAFVRLHEQQLIYRDIRLVNWCTRLNTAISDIEVDYITVEPFGRLKVPAYEREVQFGVLTSFAYPLESGGGEVVVATTRPETMLGDTAVAVHPEDSRRAVQLVEASIGQREYKHLHGKCVIHPFNGRKIPIVTDSKLVDMNFGTGCVKITPAHDPNDFAVGKRHALDIIPCYGEDGIVNEQGGPFKGMARFDAREAVVEALKEKNLYRGEEGNEMRLGICSRSKDVIEPLLKPQWWVNCKGMASRGCDAVRNGELEILPNSMEAAWFRWLEDIKDWCISRQLWWGHRIPAYYIKLEGENESKQGTSDEDMNRWVIGRRREEALEVAKNRFGGQNFELYQDEDVLDTWFSSGLFPFSTLGWPRESQDLKDFYPNTILETGHDILFFWVARMVMMGLQLTGKLPFHRVYLHAMVRDAHGRKMSKSFGNVIDPLQVIEGASLAELHQSLDDANLGPKELEKAKEGQKRDFPNGIPECGTDALRFALVAYTAQGRDVNLDVLRVQGYRHWCNKLWNAIRFAMINLGEEFVPSDTVTFQNLPMPHRWILSRLNNAIDTVLRSFEKYEFSPGTTAMHFFWQYELCDVFIEVIKPLLAGEDEDAKLKTREVLYNCLEMGLRMLHPVMPFLTEELWQRLPRRASNQNVETIMLSGYPQPVREWYNEGAEAEMEVVSKVVRAARSVRASYNLTPKQRTYVYVQCKDASEADKVERNAEHVQALCCAKSVFVLRGESGDSPPAGCGIYVLDHSNTVYVHLADVVNVDQEVAKLDKRIEDLQKQAETARKQLEMHSAEASTPEHIKQSFRDKIARLEEELQTAQSNRENFLDLKKHE